MPGGDGSEIDLSDYDKMYATIINYRSSLGALVWLLYDICITLGDEINFVWPKPWTYMKILYTFIRYVPLFVQITILTLGSPEITPQFHFTAHDCFIWQVYQGVAALSIFAAVDYVLILRVYALYHNHPTLRRCVLGAFALELTGMSVGLGLSLPGIQFDEICVVDHISGTLLIYAGSALLFQAFLFVLTTIKFVRAVREGWGDTPLVNLVMRDGTWAFFFLFAIIGGEACLYIPKNHFFAGVLYGWLLSVFSFSGYRILLNLNRLDASFLPTTSPTTTNNSHIQFSTRITVEREAAALHSYELSTLNASGANG